MTRPQLFIFTKLPIWYVKLDALMFFTQKGNFPLLDIFFSPGGITFYLIEYLVRQKIFYIISIKY